MKLNIVIATGGLSFHGNTDREKALGGSETAVINVARELSKRGHYVRVFCNTPAEGLYEGVSYFDINKRFSSFVTHGECDICIISRFHGFLAVNKIHSKLNILWNHDVLVDEQNLLASLWQYDYMYCLSNYHKQQYLQKIPSLGDMIKLVPNGVDATILQCNDNKKHRIMFTSRPERGLWEALTIFENYNDKDLEFLICNYNTIADENVRKIEELCTTKIRSLRMEGFKISTAQFNKVDLYNAIAESKAVLYPTEFPEIFCISAIEAQMNGTVFITSDNFALQEVVGYERCTRTTEFTTMLMKVLRDDTYRRALEAKGLLHTEKYTWALVAEQIINDAHMYFLKRSEDVQGVQERLIYESNLMLAREMCTTKNAYAKLNHDLRFVEGKEEYKSIYEDEDTYETPDFAALSRVPRLQWPAEQAAKFKCKSVLSYGCHNGVAEILISNNNPDCHVTGYDVSEKIITQATDLKNKYALYTDKIGFIASLDLVAKEYLFDALFIGEVLEHVADPEKLIEELEQYVKPGGKIFCTLPRGAWEWISHEENIRKDVVYHVHCFDWWDIQTMFNVKKDFDLVEYHDGQSFGYYGEALGNYLITYTVDRAIPTQKRDAARKYLMSRPYQSITACIIARNAEKTIEKLIDSIHFEVDEIVIGIDHDEGECVDFIKRIEKYPKVRWFYVSKRIVADKYGFAAARNETVAHAKSKWVFWIDTDEELLKKEKFRKYLDTPYYNAFNLQQQHPQIDGFLEADKPQRLFRKGTGTFVGYIHEQVQDIKNINKGVIPSVILSDTHVLNFGEIHEGMRRGKAMGRNLDLLEVDIRENVDKRAKQGLPIRYMSIVLLMRDFLNRIIYSIEAQGTHQTKDIESFSLPQIYSLYNKYFSGTDFGKEDIYFQDLAYKMKYQAMDLAQVGTKVEIKLGNETVYMRLDTTDIAKLKEKIETLKGHQCKCYTTSDGKNYFKNRHA